MATGNTLKCTIVTPERAVLDEAVDFVAVPMYDGELGVLPGRAPLIGRLGFGELRARRGATTRRYFIDGGFVQVRDNVVSVLTSQAVPAEEITPALVEAKVQTARIHADTPEGRDALQLALAKGRVMRRVGRPQT